MTVAIIGTGNMGAGLARLFVSKGLEVAIGHRDSAKAAALAQQLGGSVESGGTAAVAKLADIIFLAVPYPAAAQALKEAGDLAGKIVVDISNPVTEDYKGLTIGHSTSAAEELQKAALGAQVVKAFNTIFAGLLPETERKNGAALQVFVAGDDESAKTAVSELIEKGGFEAVDTGPLSNARFIEPLGELNIHMGFFLGHGTTVAPAWINTRRKAV